ncbi:DUF4825 domain-containing protein [Terracoccus sp. 273MFTsu3.1]|uniref:DUF4825 domain-containing protein n=1 Tax=Terracoccus sp. 273MFTsu3.1 TaxID=1172188 RepID=UPI000382B3D6|nr:DUF4825 domain-containing protein [Terracoccus sp. 273MFTsu3.1]
MVRNVVASLAVGVLALAGCTTSPADDPSSGASGPVAADDRAQALWADRTAYVGDNSRVVALVEDAGFGPVGSFSLSLWTTRPPYAVTITVTDPAKPLEATDLTGPATLLLGTVTNLDAVHVTGPGREFSLTAREATAALGHDVKTLGTDRGALADYVRSLDD